MASTKKEITNDQWLYGAGTTTGYQYYMYRITIEKSEEKDERGYEKFDKVYEQTLDKLDVSALVVIINKEDN